MGGNYGFEKIIGDRRACPLVECGFQALLVSHSFTKLGHESSEPRHTATSARAPDVFCCVSTSSLRQDGFRDSLLHFTLAANRNHLPVWTHLEYIYHRSVRELIKQPA